MSSITFHNNCEFFSPLFCLKSIWYLEMFHAAGRKDITSEFHVMSSSLSKEMEMMETQLKQWKETAHETLSLREKSQSLKASLSTKVYFHSQLLLPPSVIVY